MSNVFLRVDKDWLGIGFSPIELLIVSQILEYQTKDNQCFISDETMATNFGVSSSTIARAVKGLETKGLLNRDTKNTNKGRLRYLTINIDKLNALHNSQNDSCENKEVRNSQFDNSANVNLTFSNRQNDSIKDNNKKINNKKENCELNPKGKVEVMSEVLKDCSKNPNEFNF